jgi:hypothetical protein
LSIPHIFNIQHSNLEAELNSAVNTCLGASPFRCTTDSTPHGPTGVDYVAISIIFTDDEFNLVVRSLGVTPY